MHSELSAPIVRAEELRGVANTAHKDASNAGKVVADWAKTLGPDFLQTLKEVEESHEADSEAAEALARGRVVLKATQARVTDAGNKMRTFEKTNGKRYAEWYRLQGIAEQAQQDAEDCEEDADKAEATAAQYTSMGIPKRLPSPRHDPAQRSGGGGGGG